MPNIQADTTKTWGELWPFLRDELTSVTGWTLETQGFHTADGSGGGTGTTGETSTFHRDRNVDLDGDGNNEHDYIVLSTPTGEYLSFRAYDDPGDPVRWEYGDTFTVGDGQTYPTGYSGEGSGQRMYLTSGRPGDQYTTDVRYSDSVTFWLSYDSEGFFLYYTREENDGYDFHGALGWSQVSKVWDYTQASAKESEGVVHYHNGTPNTDYREVRRNAFGNAQGTGTQGSVGILNPDPDLESYITHDTTTLSSSQFQNAAGRQAPTGTHDRWLNEESGTDVAHEDIIQLNGSNEYIILKEYSDEDNYSVVMRLL